MTGLTKLWIIASVLGLSLSAPKVLADSPTPSNQFPVNPLEITTPDPLLPQPIGRPLNGQEQQALIIALDELDAQAAAQLKAGDATTAFEIWNRELRLRRALGPLAEVKALGRVGQIAWQENETTEVRLITERLLAIQLQAQSQPLPDVNDQLALQKALGRAYVQVRARELALNVYQQVLTAAQQRQDKAAEVAALTTIGELHLNWFDYAKAATAFEELLVLLRTEPNLAPVKLTPKSTATDDEPDPFETPLTEVDVLKKLAYLYEQDKKLESAIVTQQQLVQLLEAQTEPELIPALKLAIAINYQALNQLEPAIVHYQQAYTLAQTLQQFAYASEALKRLGELYRSQNQLESALRIYQFLLDVEKQSYNVYGSMTVYDQMGQIYLARQNYPQAIAAFQQGLVLAKQLKYREDYFTNQIQQLLQPKR